MSIDAAGAAAPPQVLAALAAIASTQAAELALATTLEQGVAAVTPSADPNLGQNLNLVV